MRLAAVDLGATSGRVMVAEVGPGRLDLVEVHRFANGPVRHQDGSLRWDITRLYDEVLAGLRAAGPVQGIGIDSWAVDYGLLDGSGRLLGDPYCYRDGRTHGVQARGLAPLPPEGLYAPPGLQQLPFNTIYQLAAEPSFEGVETMLLIPDLIAYWLTGAVGAEATNASTTQLYDVRDRAWSSELAGRVDVPAKILPPLREPGEVLGTLTAEAAAVTGLPASTPVIAVGSHDTASAVVGVPAGADAPFAYISSGTWSLVGVELPAPVLTEAAREANFTNEGGVDATTRFLRNVMGLWVLNEAMRTWGTGDLAGVLADASAAPAFGPVVDIDGPEFLAPGDMPARIESACLATGQAAPSTRGEMARCILESLALAYRRTVRQAADLSGRSIEMVHVVGGGVRNDLLCRLTADACDLPVLAGPVEAAALGNVLVQARTLGGDVPALAAMRALVGRTHEVRRYDPDLDASRWDEAERRLGPRPVVQG